MSERMSAVQSPIIPIVGGWIRQTPGTISLGQGMVAYGPPPQAFEAIAPFLSDPQAHRYGPVEGLPELVETLGQKLKTENRLDLDHTRIFVTAGGNLAFMKEKSVEWPGKRIMHVANASTQENCAILPGLPSNRAK